MNLGTEKEFYASPNRSIKLSHYFSIYDHLFSQYVGTEVVFLEIGVLGGGSLQMWRSYFGPKARIIGVDLNEESKKWQSDGFEIYIGDQADPVFWEYLKRQVGQVDVILDDGGHTYMQQISSVHGGLELLKQHGGLIIVEDTFTSYQKGFGSSRYSFINWAKSIADDVNRRSSLIKGRSSTNSFWAIQFFESVVAFHVRPESIAGGVVIDNGREHQVMQDFRYHDDPVVSKLDSMAYKLAWLDRIPGVQRAYKFMRGSILLITSNIFLSEKRLRKVFNKKI